MLDIDITNNEICSIYCPEATTNDIIFNTDGGYGRRTNPNSGVLSENDPMYNKPDSEVYIFSTMGKNLRAVHRNNLVTPIRHKQQLNNYNTYAKFDATGVEDRSGVYIVKYYNLYNENSTNLQGLLAHYINTGNIEEEVEVARDISNAFINGLSNKPFNNRIKIRVISFIPKSDITRKGYCYVKDADVLIVNSLEVEDYRHPFSVAYQSNCEKLKLDNKNIITIDLVQQDKGSPKYIKVGNSVVTIHPSFKYNKQDGCEIKFIRSGVTVCEEIIKPDKLKEYGLYDSEAEAEVSGDLNKSIELERLALERDKLKLDKEKYGKEIYKLELELMLMKQTHNNKLEMLDLESKKKYQEFYVGIYKAYSDISVMNVKNNLEMTSLNARFGTDAVKQNLDVGSKVLATALGVAKYIAK